MSVPDAEAPSKQDLINAQLQTQFLEPQFLNLGFGSVLVAAVAIFLWPHADHRGLVLWVGLVVVTLVPAAIMKWSNPPFRTLYPLLVVTEILSGLAWGSGSLLAMPRTTIWQSIMLILFVAVLLSGASSLGHFYGIFLSFQLPFAISVCVGFLIRSQWPIAPFLVLWVTLFLYVAATAFESRETQSTLVSANLDLEAANQLLDVQARTDNLTGLANRLEFVEQLDARVTSLAVDTPAGEVRRPVTLAYLDIDRFKQINDEFGHHAGDELLQQSATRLMAAATENEIVARLGGDELTVLSSVDARSLGMRVLGCFEEPFVIDGRVHRVKVSVGVASADSAISGEELMRNADAALYAAKDAGGARHVEFGTSLKLHTEHRVSIESELQSALVNGEIVPWLQPIVDLETGEIIAAEALARWNHRDGVRSAASFIEPIRQVGLMAEFTEQFLRSVADFQASVRSFTLVPVPVSINLPCSHLHQLVDLDGLAPLIVEVTEETAIDEIEETRELLKSLQRAGHKIWLDDFSTGLSSLAVAAQLPIDGLKVDRAFVAEILTSSAVRGVVAAMVELGEQLSVQVVAEGVENYAQASRLREFGIRVAQGHLWSPAVPFEDFAAWLSEGHRFAVEARSTTLN